MITLNAQPMACAIVSKSAAVVDATRSTGAATIGYAPADRENLATTHPGAGVASLADLVLRLRSRPLCRIEPFSCQSVGAPARRAGPARDGPVG
jgi:hypothetical protein